MPTEITADAAAETESVPLAGRLSETAPRSECVLLDNRYRADRSLGIGWYRLRETSVCTVCHQRSTNSRLYARIANDPAQIFCTHCFHIGRVCQAGDERGIEVWAIASETFMHSNGYRYTFPESEEVIERRGREQMSRVHDYSTNILNVLGRYAYVGASRVELDDSERREILLGVELELDRRDNETEKSICAAVMDSTTYGTYGFVKHDGTCSGGEYVTLPCDLDAHRSTLDWKGYCDVLRPLARGFHGRDNGMHIHINRRALTPTVLGRMLIFLNEPVNAPFLTMIAQRPMSSDSSWCKMIKKTMADGYRNSRDRYQILNVSDYTAELRMFKSTLLPQRILKNLEFAEAIVTWCRKGGRLQFLTPGAFVDYVCSHKARYPELERFIRERWIPGHPASATIEE